MRSMPATRSPRSARSPASAGGRSSDAMEFSSVSKVLAGKSTTICCFGMPEAYHSNRQSLARNAAVNRLDLASDRQVHQEVLSLIFLVVECLILAGWELSGHTNSTFVVD